MRKELTEAVSCSCSSERARCFGVAAADASSEEVLSWVAAVAAFAVTWMNAAVPAIDSDQSIHRAPHFDAQGHDGEQIVHSQVTKEVGESWGLQDLSLRL